MHKRITLAVLVLSSSFVLADNLSSAESSPPAANHAFQEFDNQFYLGYGTTYGNLTSAYGQNTNYGSTVIGVGVERLFDMGLWVRVDGALLSGYSNFNSTNPNAKTGPMGQDPSVANLNAKIGYAFNALPNELLVTPYIQLGRNTNLTSNSLTNNITTSPSGVSNLTANVTQDFFLTSGIGARVEYRLNKYIMVYGDQSALYNADMSSPVSTYNPASNYQFVTTLGGKFNVWDQLQLGLVGTYNYSQLSGASSFAQQYELYPQNQIGIMATVGLTY